MSGEQMFLGIKLQLDASGVVSGASLAGNSLDSMQAKTRQTGQAMQQASTNMMADALKIAGALGTVAMASSRAGDAVMNNFLAPSMQQAKAFETEMSQLKFVTQGTAQEMERLKGVAVQTGLATQFSPQEAAAGIRMLKAAGLETDKALQSLNATLDIVTGSAGTIALKEGATATAASLLKFVNTGESAREIMDAFAQSTRETNMQMGDLPGVIDAMRDAPTKLQMTAAQTFALAGVMRSAGMATRSAGLNVTMFADRLILAQRRVSKYLRRAKITEEQFFDPRYMDDAMPDIAFQFKRLGVHMFDANGQMRDATELLMDMTDRAKELKGESQKVYLETASAILGPKSSAVLTALMNFRKNGKQASAAFEDLVKSLETAPGASRESASAIENTTEGMEKFIEGTEQTIAILQGTALLPAIKKFHVGLRTVLNSVLEYVEANPDFTASIGATAAGFYVISKVVAVVAVGLAAATLWVLTIGPAFATAGVGVAILAAGFTILKFALIGVGAVALGVIALFALFRGAVFLWRKIWDEDAQGVFMSIQIFFRSVQLVWQGFIAFVQGNSISEELYKSLETAGLMGFVIWLVQIKTRFVAVFGGIKDGIKDGLIPLFWGLNLIGNVLAWVIDRFSQLMTEFTGSDMTESIAGWQTLGYVIGVVAAVWMTKMTVVAAIWIAKIVPSMLLGLLRLSFRFLVLGVRMVWFAATAIVGVVRGAIAMSAQLLLTGIRMIWFGTVALMSVIRKMVVVIAHQAVLTAMWVAANVKALLLAAAVIAIGVAYAFVITKAIEFGEQLGPMIYDWINKATVALFDMYTMMKNMGGKIGKAFTEAIKGNFEPFLQYIQDAWVLIKTSLAWIVGDATDKQMKTAMAKIGMLGPTDSEKEENRAGANALLRGADVGKAMDSTHAGERVSAYVQQRNEQVMQYREVISALKAQGRSVHIEKIELATHGKSPEEAARLAKDMAFELAKNGDNEAEVEFSQ